MAAARDKEESHVPGVVFIVFYGILVLLIVRGKI